jgi:hypothetical protein
VPSNEELDAVGQQAVLDAIAVINLSRSDDGIAYIDGFLNDVTGGDANRAAHLVVGLTTVASNLLEVLKLASGHEPELVLRRIAELYARNLPK